MKENDMILKRAEQNDLTEIYRWLNSEIIMKYFGGRDHEKPSIEEIEKEYGPQNNPNLLMIYYRNRPVGFIDIFEFSNETNIRHGLSENDKKVLSFDIVVGEVEFHNIGIGSTALNMLLHKLFFEKAANKVVLDTYVWHKQAIRCYEKCGFRATRILKDHDVYEGKKADDVFMEISKDEYIQLNDFNNNVL